MEEIDKNSKTDVIDIEEIIPKKYRCFTFILYEETTSYNFKDVLFSLNDFKYYAYIRHLPEEDEKKIHYHVIIKLDNATTCEGISKRLGVPIQHIKYVRNIRAMCRYLIHLDDDNKIRYKYEDVVVSKLFERKFKKHFEDLKTEEEIMQDIYNFIDNYHCDTYTEKLKQLITFVNINCYDTIYKRYRYEFLDYLKENL